MMPGDDRLFRLVGHDGTGDRSLTATGGGVCV
jgi:hypothetical protein